MNRNSSDSERSESKRRRSHSRSRERKPHPEPRQKKVKMKMPDLSLGLHSYKQFAYLQTDVMTSETIQKGYDKYKRDWEQRQDEDFINENRKETWFNERYNPQVLDLLQKERKELVGRLQTEFSFKLDSGALARLDLRVQDTVISGQDQNQLGTIAQLDEQEQNQYNSSNFLNNQTLELHLSSSIDITKPPYFGYDPDKNTLFLRALSKEISRFDVKTLVENLPGFRGLTMSDPLRKAKFTRNCWVEFENEENCSSAIAALATLNIKNQILEVSRAFTKIKRVRVLRNYPSSRLQSDAGTMLSLAVKLDKQCNLQPLAILSDSTNRTPQQQFDLCLTYLRKVHAFDYFTCTQYENQRVLALRTGSAFLRTEADYVELPGLQTVFRKIQQNAEAKLSSPDPVEHMWQVRQEVEKFIRETEQVGKDQQRDIWKCLYCDKRFKTCDFLVKHMVVRHEQIKNKKLQLVMEQLYHADPMKITNYSHRDERQRKNFGGGFRREKRKQVYRDFDEPEEAVVQRVSTKPIVNFLDI